MLLRKLLCACALALFATHAWGNLANTVVFEVRTTGSGTNGGCFDPSVASPGTDYSQQNSAQIAYSDLVIGSTNTQLTSAAHPFTSAAVGNCIQVTGGTGFTTSFYEVLSVSGVTATMDRAVGVASSTGGTGNLGGAFNSPLAILPYYSIMNGATVWVKAGTYTYTSLNSGGPLLAFFGYNTTRGDNGAGGKPLLTTSTSSIDMLALGAGSWQMSHIDMSNTAATRGLGMYAAGTNGININLEDCVLTGFSNAINADNTGAHYIAGSITIHNSWIKNSTGDGVRAYTITGNGIFITDSLFTGNGADGIECPQTSGILYVNRSVFYSNTNNGVNCNISGNVAIVNSVFLSNGAAGATVKNMANPMTVENDIFYGNTTNGFIDQTIPAIVSTNILQHTNGYGSNGSGNFGGYAIASQSDVALTANPFTNPSGFDFSLNSTSGGGAALRAAGFPGTISNSASTGHLDIGTIQSSGGGGGGSAANSSYAH